MTIEEVYDHSCSRCVLSMSATSICVSGVGNPASGAVIVGEAPGADEDRVGVPFVGASGQLLDECLEDSGASREDVWITNAVKCRPPGNREPSQKETDACITYLYAECEVIKPRVMLLLGNVPMKVVLGWTGITRERGIWRLQVTDWGPMFVLPTFHPAFCKRQPQRTPDLKKDVETFLLASAHARDHSPAATWQMISKAPFKLDEEVQWGGRPTTGQPPGPTGQN